MAYTQLSVIALPGKRHLFLAKIAGPGPHIGLFTALSVDALPGKRHLFSAKTSGEVAVAVVVPFTNRIVDIKVLSSIAGTKVTGIVNMGADIVLEGNSDKITITDENQVGLLNDILTEFKKLNLYMSMVN